MPTIAVKLTYAEVETLAGYNENVGFPIGGIFCEFGHDDERWLASFYELCAERTKRKDLVGLIGLVKEHLHYTYIFSNYLSILRRTGEDDATKPKKAAPSLMLLLFLCNVSGYDFSDVLAHVKNMRMGKIKKNSKNTGMKIIHVLIKQGRELQVSEIKSYIKESFGQDIERGKLQATCQAMERGGFLRKRCEASNPGHRWKRVETITYWNLKGA